MKYIINCKSIYVQLTNTSQKWIFQTLKTYLSLLKMCLENKIKPYQYLFSENYFNRALTTEIISSVLL